jgi:flavin reductase (DIM6/NTAB) family NADH-FMN oxidoreductase RutF/rubredoxin
MITLHKKAMINFEALFKITYGLYIVSSGDKVRGNGFISNTVFQVTAEPPRFAVCCNKNNYTAEFIQNYKTFSVSVLAQSASAELFGKFGYRSGRDFDKMAGTLVKYGDTGVPIVLDETLAFLECRVIQMVDVGTHLMFVGELVNAEILDDSGEPLTYAYFRQVKKGVAPKNAPTYIDKSKIAGKSTLPHFKKYQCPACGHIYDESVETVKFADLPGDWVCPSCGVEKAEFIEMK